MNNINYVNLGEKIKSTRKERGYTQEKLAEICDISTGFLGHIERGTRKLSLDTLFCIATVLNVSIDYLLIDSANKLAEMTILRFTFSRLIVFGKSVSLQFFSQNR